MSSGFVSGSTGTDYDPTSHNPPNTSNDDAWRAAQRELAEARARREEAASSQHEGKSLYEVLQANKAAKDDAFAEATRLANQYRALDDDEAEFLANLREENRKKEEAVKRETQSELERFRLQKEEAERKAREEEANSVTLGDEDVVAGVTWTVPAGRKRKREKGGVEILKGVKVRRASEGTEGKGGERKSMDAPAMRADAGEGLKKSHAPATGLSLASRAAGNSSTGKPSEASKPEPTPPKAAPAPSLLNVGYGSSDDDH
ncbi:hypothetical protein M011DRAFT_525802 [Sporormia fimetaria CBS 119925]|uniref:FAM192A/Fyv6 N-terminal domain-containing protein n=1 Tax=Sporormia fimetaria CBS 119925 TaxID=1340428 RepID=A0A6A6VC18_9PLEO|nr:hypothetical protein M011DRAFT_525802 [Sporormia fimetaria CBS 119925]